MSDAGIGPEGYTVIQRGRVVISPEEAMARESIGEPPVPLSKAVIVLPEDGSMVVNEDGTVEGARALRHCQDPIHVFEEIPGRCQCGDRYWGGVFEEIQ